MYVNYLLIHFHLLHKQTTTKEQQQQQQHKQTIDNSIPTKKKK